MKHCIVFGLLLLPAIGIGQQVVSAAKADSLASQRLNELLATWTLGIDSTTETVDMKIYSRFKGLFDLAATIEDRFDVKYHITGENAGAYLIPKQAKPFDEYAHNTALEVSGITLHTDSIVRIDSSLADPQHLFFRLILPLDFQKSRRYVLPDGYATHLLQSRKKIRFENDTANVIANLNRLLSATAGSVYRFRTRDTVLIRMAYEKDTVRITGITVNPAIFVVINDNDGDAVLQQEDSLPRTFGDFTTNGIPDYDLDGVPDSADKCQYTYGKKDNAGCPASYFIRRSQLDVFVGAQIVSHTTNLPELNQLGYVDGAGNGAIDVLQSKKGILKNPGNLTALNAGAFYTYYFGQRKRRSGLSSGFTYTAFSGQYELTESMVYTYKANDGINDYRRQISINRLTEEMNFTVLNLALLFAHRLPLAVNKKSVLSVQAGPSFLLVSNRTSYDAAVDFGGLYQIDTLRRDKITYYDYFNDASTYNLYFTPAQVSFGGGQSAGADSIFQQLARKNYDFAHNKAFQGIQTISRSAVAFNLAVDLQHQISEGLTLRIGAHYLFAPSFKSSGKYKPVDNTTDQFQSIYNGNAKSGFRSTGLNLGVVYQF